MTQAVAKHQPQAVVEHEGNAVLSMIERAARDPQVDIEKMRQLLEMRAQEEQRAAKRAFASALSEMQLELPVIEKHGKIDIGRGKPQKYALWEDINEAIKPGLARHGFALSFRCGQTESKISVTGVLSHRDGHSEETTIHLPLDTSGSKNAVQAVGSSTSYGKRYTAAALLNLTSRDEDDDAKTAAGGFVTPEQAKQIGDALDFAGADQEKFLKWAKVERVEDIPAAHFQSCLDAIARAAQARK